ncbi:MAG TPA: glycoside hydrolase family 3 C-terminal domain-containing protein [Actinospica sp.]|nr:glycoside hydrolase family 3 C-terminal domain-containing protein [Actinospica sp.]
MELGQIDQGEPGVEGVERRRPAPNDMLRATVAALTLEQKVRLLTGADNFSLAAEPAISLHGMHVSDGPAGVRGPVLDPDNRSSSPPAPLALAATWDPGLVEQVAAEIGREAKAKGIDVVLGPTLNLARSPFSGRGFESFGEDPVLAAGIGAGFVRGMQSAGVAATAKHFVGNDTEVERWTVDVRIEETALREVYLVPFEAAVTEADCELIMAGYNLVNGTSMTEHGYLLDTVLKREWGFAGVVVSDWFAARSTAATANAGLDLVMPGPIGPWGGELVDAVARGEVDEAEVDEKLTRLLRVAAKVGALGGPAPAAKAGPHADRGVLRRAAARSFVLVRNVGSILPLAGAPDVAVDGAARNAAVPRSIAVIGPNAVDPQYQGRGSAEVGMALSVSPVEGLREALNAVVVPVGAGAGDPAGDGSRPVLRVAPGCRTWTSTPLPDGARLRDPENDTQGAGLEVYDTDGVLRYAGNRPTSEVTWWDPEPLVSGEGIGRIVLRAVYTAGYTGTHRIAVGGIGELELLVRTGVGGETVHVGGAAPHPADAMVSFAGPYEFEHELRLVDGETVEFTGTCTPDGYKHELIRFRVGIVPLPSAEELLRDAVEAARDSDVAVLVVGSTHTTESEGYDRESLALPGRQDELIAAVAAVNPRTVVVVNSGMPILMPWADRVAAIVQVWFPGQEFGHALADVLLGRTEPSGRLPVTMPRSEHELPIGRAAPVNGRLEYDEGLLVGYRGYDRAMLEPRFAFGHGLGYTAWSFERLEVPVGRTRTSADVEIIVAVGNIGPRAGELVVQAYLSGPDQAGDPRRPVRVLAGFTRVHAKPGEEQAARIRLPHRAFARWDAAAGAWDYPTGTYVVEVGFSSRDLRLRSHIEIG